jgi:tetratricopeptide (TPR) repeat protein
MERNDTQMKQFEKGKRVLMKGADGDKKAVKSAYEIFLNLRKAEPDNALIEGYYGSALALLARDAAEPLEKADKAQEGLDSLNQAISMDPNQKEIRLLRAKVCLRLPETFFHCSQTAIEDFSFLLEHYKEDPSYLSDTQVREIMENLSAAYQKAGNFSEANEVLQRLTQLNSQVENVSEKDIEILEQGIPLHKVALRGNEKAVQEKNNDTQMKKFEEGKRVLMEGVDGDKEDLSAAYQKAGNLSEANEVLQSLTQLNRQVEKVSEKDIEIFLEQVIPLHKEALGGNKKAVQDMNKLLDRARSDYPGHPLVDAYHGITMMLIARNKTSPLGKLRGTKAGLKILDEAVSAAPQDSRIRLLRGRAAYRLPENYFHRARTVIEDYTFLIDWKMHGEGFLETENYLQLIYELGEAYCRIGRNQSAAMCWNRLKNETKDPDFLHLLKLKLKSLEGKPAVEHIPIPESPKSILIRKAIRAAGSELLSWGEQQK